MSGEPPSLVTFPPSVAANALMLAVGGPVTVGADAARTGPAEGTHTAAVISNTTTASRRPRDRARVNTDAVGGIITVCPSPVWQADAGWPTRRLPIPDAFPA